MDETDILEYRCKFCQKPFRHIWQLNNHIKREHTTPQENNILGIMFQGVIIAFIPAAILGAIVTWLAWEVKPHNAAVIAGMIIFLAVLWIGAWLAAVVGNAEEN